MSIMKFYFTPGSCSTGIHILLEEIGVPFEAWPVNLVKGEQYRPEFLAINHKGTVPVLVLEDGTALTEFIAIAMWLAKNCSRKPLLPETTKAQIDMLDLMNLIISACHGQGFTRIFTTERYTRKPEEHEQIRNQGRNIVQGCLSTIDARIRYGRIVGEQFSIADAALFYVEFWAAKTGIPLPEACHAHYQRMLQRPSVRQVLMEEGYHSTLAGEPVAIRADVHAVA